MPSTVPGTTANESAKEIKEKDARTPLLNELIKTERDFVQSLEQLYEYQMELLSIRTLSFDIGTTLFANLSELIEFQRGFLDEMEVELGLGPGNQRIGGLFLRHEAAFQVYYPFCRNYQNAINVILMECEQLRALEHIIASQQLQSYLIKPLQRLMRYPMLLKELIKLTDPNTYPYMEELNKAADAVKKITETLNELQRKDENARIKIDFLERLEDSKSFLSRQTRWKTCSTSSSLKTYSFAAKSRFVAKGGKEALGGSEVLAEYTPSRYAETLKSSPLSKSKTLQIQKAVLIQSKCTGKIQQNPSLSSFR
ncbi:hypothetical protein HDU99_002400 [Rhizoclosmatium hyalinum]|nr:hypothetical protein HDU99_002400 [Rhizoclosmatium hyalinum]